jgi:hypothetical protein
VAVSTNGDDGLVALGAEAIPWQVDYGKVTPLLVKAIQDLNFKVETGFSTMSQADIDQYKKDGSLAPEEIDPVKVAAHIESIKAEAPRNVITYITDMMLEKKRAVKDFVSEKVTAIVAYFDEIYTNRSHQKELCVGDSANGGETCITKAQLDALLSGQGSQSPANNTGGSGGNGGGSTPPTCTAPQVLNTAGNTCVDPEVPPTDSGNAPSPTE